jgi:hypothetical protein
MVSTANGCGPYSRPSSKRTRKWWASPTRNCPRRGSCRNPMSALGSSNAPSLADRRSVHLASQAPRTRLPHRAPKTSWSHTSPKCGRLWFPGKGTRNMAPHVPGLSTQASCRSALRGGKCRNTSPPRKCSDGSIMESRWSSNRVFPLRQTFDAKIRRSARRGFCHPGSSQGPTHRDVPRP